MTHNLKIAFWHFYTFRMRRGIETMVVSLSNALVRKGHEVSIVTASPHLELFVKPDPAVKIFAYPTFRYFEHVTIVPFYLRHFEGHSYDFVVVFFADFGEGLTYKLLRPGRKPPLALYLAFPYSAVPHRYRSFLKYGFDRAAKKILAVSPWVVGEAEAIFGRPISVLPTGVDPEKIKPDAETRRRMREHFGYSEGDIVLLNMAALEKRKGAWRVLEAVGRLREKLPHLKYHIVGSGPYEPHLKEMVQRLNLEGRVFFEGESRQHSMFYNMADIFVMLPDAEANSLAFLEAMSSGMPVVVSNTPGFTENASPEVGFFVDPEDPEAVDAALLRLASDASLREAMGSAGRAFVRERVSWDKLAERFLELLK